MKNVNFGMVLATISFFLSGCGSPIEDLSSSPKYNFDSFSGTVWKTKVKVAVADLNSDIEPKGTPRTYLLEPQAFDPKHPEYTPPYRMEIIEVLPVGTRLRIEQTNDEKDLCAHVCLGYSIP